MKKLNLIAFSALIFTGSVMAQTQRTDNWCYSDEHLQDMQQNNPSLISKQQQFLEGVRNFIDNNPVNSTEKAFTYVIPVVFHLITDGGAGYVPKSDVDAVMATINEDFQRMNSDASQTRALFLPYASSINIEFRLAHIDPNGNCTEGIVRKDSPLSSNATDAVKAVSYWNSKKYFNIWSVKNIDGASGNSIIAGYAQFPWSGINSTYGVVVDYRFVKGGERTLTHEIGHCLSLLHTFQSGCGSNCSNSGDGICDTPPVTTSSFGCPTTNNTCSNDASGPDPFGTNVLDQIENYMSYNGCQNMFTAEQTAAMTSILTSTSTTQGLAQLMGSNLSVTGVADPYGPVVCAPIAEFSYSKEYICEGSSITYTDDSYNATPTSWSWSFPGGTPSTSTASNPTITYNTAGVYSATLTSITAAGSSAPVTKTSIINVSSSSAQYTGPIVDGFEISGNFSDWRVENLSGGQTWQRNTAAAYTGNASVRIRNYFTGTTGEVDELISPSFDISALSAPAMKFKVAYAKKTATDADKLFVYYSINCGSSWTLKTPLVGSTMASVPDQGNVFTPSSTSQWIEKTVDLSAVAGATNVRFKFAFTSGGGNDIYLDDINITGAVGINELSNIGSFNVYPNPTNSSAQVSFNLVKDVNNLTVKVKNAIGQDVANVINNKSYTLGSYNLKIDEGRKLPAGIYFIEFNADNVIQIQKLIVQ